MRFGNSLMRAASAIVERAATKRTSFLEVVTANDPYTPAHPKTMDMIGLYNSSPWVRSIVGKIARGVASKQWYLEDASGKRIDKHPALDFLRSGTKRLPARLARQLTTIHMDLAGEAFWAVGEGVKGKPVGFAPIPPHWVTDIPKSDDPSETYEIQTKSHGVIYKIPASQIIHFRDVDPLDPYARGASAIRAIRTDIDTDAMASAYLATFFKNNARPDFIVSGSKEAPMNARDAGRLEETWANRFRGVTNRFKPLFSAAPLEIHELSGSLRDNEVSKLKPQLSAAIAEFYGIPPEIIGRLENSNRATIDAADHLFGKFVLEDRLAALLDVLAPELDARFGLDGLTLKYETAIQEDRAFNLTVMQAKPGAFARNEFRTLAGLKPLTLPGFDVPEPEPTLDPNNDNGGPDKPDDPTDTPPDKPKKSTEPAIVKDSFTVKSLSPADIIRVAEAHLDPQVTANATDLMDEIFQKLLETYGGELLGILDTEARFQVTGRVAEWLAERGSRLINAIDETTANALKASLVEGAAANQTVAELANRVELIFSAAAANRAPIIGQTEATAITGFGSLEAARQGGFERKKWLSSGDHIVRNSHRAMHGQTQPVSHPFQAPNGAQADYPGGFGVAAEDINCRCAMRPVLDGEKAITDDAFETAWDGMNAEAAAAITRKVADIFHAQKAVVLYALGQIGGANV
jgi:HK97 family phage portal protein